MTDLHQIEGDERLGVTMAKQDRFQCAECGKVTAGRLPRGGDGTFYFPRRHQVEGEDCPGNVVQARWMTIDASEKLRSVSEIEAKIAETSSELNGIPWGKDQWLQLRERLRTLEWVLGARL